MALQRCFLHALASLLLAGTAQFGAAQSVPEGGAEPAQSTLNSALFYQLLIGELNVQGGDPAPGYAIILDAARRTNDPRLFQRAVDVALQGREGESALQAARAWRQAVPASREANRYELQILIGMNRITETVEPLQREFSAVAAESQAVAIAAVPRYFARATDKKLAALSVEQALREYLGKPDTAAAAWTAVGRMRHDALDSSGALDAVERAQAADPGADGPALLALAMMSAKVDQAEAPVSKYLQGTPLPEIRLLYARVLLDGRRYNEAGAQLRLVTAQKPELADAWLILGTLELQDNKPAAAEKSLLRFVELAQARTDSASKAATARGLEQAYLALAQVAEQRRDFVQAESWLARIDDTEDTVRVMTRRASILAKQGRLAEARTLIQGLPETEPADARAKLSAEVQLLRDSRQYRSAYELMLQATARSPDDLDLVYDLAMLAEKLDNLPEMERLLRQVIAARPQYHHAYNALGYSLAERNVRLPEARQMILKALEFAPGDPFISDSLAWVEFRSGNSAEALRILQDAYRSRPDADIAAHLGEVLWSMGQREQALQIFREAAAMNADNETLQETLKRLRVKP